MKTLVLLGSTGSIGTQTLELVRDAPHEFKVAGLSAQTSGAEVLAQAREFRPAFVALQDAAAADEVRAALPDETQLFSGPDANSEMIAAADFDLAVNGIVGAAGLRPSHDVLAKQRPLALANKESLVIAGAELMELSRTNGVPILPVDSEHCALAQCLGSESPDRVRRLYLTASGGPFRDLRGLELDNVTPEAALRHPNWDMGPRITVGSATLMNKALEVIEAHHLFDVPAERIEVVVHRQSIVHSMVEFIDGSLIAQLGPPDMRGPIHWALHHPQRAASPLRGFDLNLFKRLDFEAPDTQRFPALELGFRCVAEGGDSGCILNAADEVAVAAFLNRDLAFGDIAAVNRAALDMPREQRSGIDGLLRTDREARAFAARTAATFSAPNPA